MSDQMTQEVLKRLDALTARLGEGAAYTWEVLVRQAYVVDGWLDIGIGVFWGLVTVALWRWAVRLSQSDDSDIADKAFFPAILGLLTALFGVGAVYFALGRIINPEYYALKILLDTISK